MKTPLLMIACIALVTSACGGCDAPRPTILVNVETSDGRSFDAHSLDRFYVTHDDLSEEETDFPVEIEATARLKNVHYFGERDRKLSWLDAAENHMSRACTVVSSFDCGSDGNCSGTFEMQEYGACVFELVGEAKNGKEVRDCWSFTITDGDETRRRVEDAEIECLPD